MLEFARRNAWIATWSNVFWNVEPEPFSVVLIEPEPLELLELLPHAARKRAGAMSAMMVRRATRDDRVDAIKVCLLSKVGIGVETKNEGWLRGRASVNDT